MMVEYLRGHKIEWNGAEYVYADTKEPTADTWKSRPCGYCWRYNTPEEHDGCIGTLPGVMNACCGHGHDDPYVQFLNGDVISGEDAKEVITKALRGEHK